MALQLTKIASTTVATPAASIDFSSIPSGYTDLILKISTRGTDNAIYNDTYLKFNNDGTGANYGYRYIRGTGSAANSSSGTSLYIGEGTGSAATSNTFCNLEIYIPNYTSSNYKSSSIDIVGENNGTEAYTHLTARLWSSTSAINQITIYPGSGSYVANSTATLYGVL